MKEDKTTSANGGANTEGKKEGNFFISLVSRLKNLSAKAKAIIIASVACLLIAVGGTVAGVLLTRETPPPPDTKVLYVSEFRYGIKAGDSEGIRLTSDWMQGLSFNKFTYKITSEKAELTLSEDMKLVAAASAAWDSAEIVFYYNTNKIATYKIDVIPDAVIIKDAAGLNSIPQGTKSRYILKNNIALASPVSIKDFRGAFYGNYFTVSGLNVSAFGGLFDSVSYGFVAGVKLKGVSGEAGGGYFGALANRAEFSRFIDCSAEGTVEVAVMNTGIHYVGGLFGRVTGYERKENTDDMSKNLFENCESAVNLTVNGGGELYAGGIAGGMTDITLANSTAKGKIEVGAVDFSFMYIGGVSGVMEKRYASPYKITYFDGSYGLLREGDISVSTTKINTLSTIYAGGIFGYTKNAAVSTATLKGSINIVTSGASVIAGGFAGSCENQLSGEGVNLKITSADIRGGINIDSRGNIYAGGLIGYAKGVKNIKTEKTLSAATVNLTDPEETRTVETGANIGHGEN